MPSSDDEQRKRQMTATDADLPDDAAIDDDGYDGSPDPPLAIPQPLRLALAGLWAACWVLGGLMLAMFLLSESGTFDSSFNDDSDGTSGWLLLLALLLTPLPVGVAGALPARLLGGHWLRGALTMNGAGIVAALLARSMSSDGIRVSAIIVLWIATYLLVTMLLVGTFRTLQLVAVLLRFGAAVAGGGECRSAVDVVAADRWRDRLDVAAGCHAGGASPDGQDLIAGGATPCDSFDPRARR